MSLLSTVVLLLGGVASIKHFIVSPLRHESAIGPTLRCGRKERQAQKTLYTEVCCYGWVANISNYAFLLIVSSTVDDCSARVHAIIHAANGL